MKDYKKMKDIILSIPNEQVIFLAGHENTDYDSIGSTLALTRYLNLIGKKAYMLLEEKEHFKLTWFNDYNYIINYKNENDFYNILDNCKNKDYVFIQLDSNRKSRLGVFENYFDNANIKINIDHHENNKEEADYILSIPEISATCEIIYNLIKLFDVNMDKSIASLLYGGIVSDTYCFYQRVTSTTFQVTSDLLNYEIDSQYIIKSVYCDRSLEELDILSYMINNIKYNDFHYIVLDKSNPQIRDVDYNVIFKKNIPIVRDINEVKLLGIFLKTIDGTIFGEFRSNCELDVDELAVILGGGGHKKASGFISSLTIEEIINIVKNYIKD